MCNSPRIPTWLPGFQAKLLYLELFSLYPSLFWELRDKRNLKNLQFWPESRGTRCWNIDISNVANCVFANYCKKQLNLWHRCENNFLSAGMFIPHFDSTLYISIYPRHLRREVDKSESNISIFERDILSEHFRQVIHYHCIGNDSKWMAVELKMTLNLAADWQIFRRAKR